MGFWLIWKKVKGECGVNNFSDFYRADNQGFHPQPANGKVAKR